MKFDVTSLFNRRADNRWDRVALGDALDKDDLELSQSRGLDILGRRICGQRK